MEIIYRQHDYLHRNLKPTKTLELVSKFSKVTGYKVNSFFKYIYTYRQHNEVYNICNTIKVFNTIKYY